MRERAGGAAAILDDLDSNYELDIGAGALYFWEWLGAALVTRTRARTATIRARRERSASAAGSARRAVPPDEHRGGQFGKRRDK